MQNSYGSIHLQAHEAGMIAHRGAQPHPMVLVECDVFGKAKPGAEVYTVNDGVCGFGWVEIKGNTGFGRWAKATGIARKAYPSGLRISAGGHSQSLERNEAYAKAYAGVLRANGISAYGCSRID